jgi:hypothetical protein
LPEPPGPVSVSRRTSGRESRPRAAANSRSRPTSGVAGVGRWSCGRGRSRSAVRLAGCAGSDTTAAPSQGQNGAGVAGVYQTEALSHEDVTA